MPRSGSTANYNLLREYLSLVANVELLGFFEDPQFDAYADSIKENATLESIRLVKTHSALPTSIAHEVALGSAFCCYSVRDLREIAVSMKRIWNMSDELVIDSLRNHTAIALDIARIPRVFMTRYELMATQADALLRSVSTFAGVEYDMEAAEKAFHAVSKLKARSHSGIRSIFYFRWMDLVLKTNRTMHIGRILKRLLPLGTVARLKAKVLFIDPVTMLHIGHVATTAEPKLSDKISQRVELEFQLWLQSFNYMTDE